MRQFLLGGNVAYGSGATAIAIPESALAFAYNKAGVFTVSEDGAGLTKEFMLVLGRKKENGGPIVLPIHSNNFSFVKSVYTPATQFQNSFVAPNPGVNGDYSVIIAKKGVKFNERNKWTATVHVTNYSTFTAQNLSDALVKAINGQGDHGVTASNSSGTTVTIKANNKGEDYTLIPCDLLTGTSVTKTAAGIPAINDAKMINDMAMQAAADAGFEYTYRDAATYLYPNYPLDALAQPNKSDAGYTVFTLKFAEPRNTKTTDEAVNQIVQVAFPTGAAGITTFDTVCKAIVNGGPAAAKMASNV